MTDHFDSQLIAIVPAGGVGQRANRDPNQPIPKQYRQIRGQTMLRWSVQALLAHPQISQVLVGVQADDSWADESLHGLARVRVLPSAGPQRADTVLQTLNYAIEAGWARQNDWVLVHDAARPGLPLLQLTQLIQTCCASQRSGLLAMPATDTVKLAREQTTTSEGTQNCAQVEKTIARQRVWLAQTPQMAKFGQLQSALTQALSAGFELTDEASALEWLGEAPLLVPGAVANFKVTWPEDFDQIERFL